MPLLAPLTNIVAIPLATPLVPLGFAAGLLGLVSLPLAGLFNTLVSPVAAALIWTANTTAGWPSLGWGEIAPVGFVYYGVGAFALALVSFGKLRLWRGLLGWRAPRERNNQKRGETMATHRWVHGRWSAEA